MGRTACAAGVERNRPAGLSSSGVARLFGGGLAAWKAPEV